MNFRLLPLFPASLMISVFCHGQTAPSDTESAPAKNVKVDVSGGKPMSAFDEEGIRALYLETKSENEKRAEERPTHLNDKNLELFEIKPLLVEARIIKLPPDLNRKLDPDDLDSLWRRLDRIDPAEANLVRWDARTDAEFMMGVYDYKGALGRHQGQLSGGITSEQLLRLLGMGRKQLEEQKATEELQR